MTEHADYLPGMGKAWLLPLYDPLTRLLGVRGVHRELVERAQLAPGLRVLEIGCGTGNLALAAKRACPAAEVTGLDPDPAALAKGRRKAARARLTLRFDQGFAQALPYPDASFDRVLSSLMLHHLDDADRPRALREVRRVLKPGGTFHLLDFAGPGGERRGFIASHLHSHRALRDNDHERVLAAMHAAGLADARVTGRMHTLAGDLLIYTAAAPGTGA
jgi:ubiquinone/menaquinone biosynthesis C-methylase UbiE